MIQCLSAWWIICYILSRYLDIWSFPKMGIALSHPIQIGIFHEINHPLLGTTISENPHIPSGYRSWGSEGGQGPRDWLSATLNGEPETLPIAWRSMGSLHENCVFGVRWIYHVTHWNLDFSEMNKPSRHGIIRCGFDQHYQHMRWNYN